MDKETLSHYGWIVILVLILAVLLALASPFGNFIAGAIKSTTAGFFMVNQNAMNSGGIPGIQIPGQEFPPDPAPCAIEGHYIGDGRGEHGIPVSECLSSHTYTCECGYWTVPDGGVYTMKTAIDEKTIYDAGEQLPCGYISQNWDTYTYGDYKYTYKTEYNGWGVSTLSEKSKYGPILENINNASVTSLYMTFWGNKTITTAPKIPNTITNMGWTFRGCIALRTYDGAPTGTARGDFSDYHIPQSVNNMDYTFEECQSLRIAPQQIPDNAELFFTFNRCAYLTTAPVISNCNTTTINYLFGSCTNLKTYHGSTDPDGDFSNYVIPNGVTSMGGTFMGCTKLTIAPKIPNSVTYMDGTFCGCTALTTAPKISNCRPTVISRIFYKCTNLKTYHGSTDPDGDFSNYIIPDSVTTVEEIFYYSKSIVKAPVVPNSVTLMTSAFKGCTALTTAPLIPSNTTDIVNIFMDCPSLKTYHGSTDPDGDFSNYIIPHNVTSLHYAFKNCSSLTSAPTVPSNITNMDNTFWGCTSLSGTIKIDANPSIYTNCFKNVNFETQNLTLVGASTRLDTLGFTGSGYCFQCKGKCQGNH